MTYPLNGMEFILHAIIMLILKYITLYTFDHFRALAVKRKLEAAKEEKRRQEILARRREEQREATDRFQRMGKAREANYGKSIFGLRHAKRSLMY